MNREIVITGVNIGDFGKGRDDTFLDLIKELDKVDGIERYRISSIEPNPVISCHNVYAGHCYYLVAFKLGIATGHYYGGLWIA